MNNQNQRSKGSKKFKPEKLKFHKLDWLEWIATAIGLWFLIYPRPYQFLFSILLFIPILGLFLNGMAGRPSIASLVEISRDSDGNDKYDVADFINFPAIIILIRVLLDFEYESLFSLILPGTIAFVLMLIILIASHKLIVKTSKSKLWIYSSIIFNICLYSYTATYGINCVFDRSEAVVFKTRVVDKHVSGRKSRHYYVKVNPWGHHHDPENIQVSIDEYNKIQPGDDVQIDLKKGLFNIPWYFIEE